MKLNIPKKAGVQTALRLPKEHWDIIVALAKENNCEKADVIRLMISEFIDKYSLDKASKSNAVNKIKIK